MRELHLEERPTTLKQVVGQPEAIAQLAGLAKSESGIPHCLLFIGPSGCGKTTLARIVRHKLGCADADFCEVNAAENRGIDMVRGIQARINQAPMAGKCRVWLIDECHQLTADAQGAFLKLLEEPPAHSYIMLATTDPQKLRKAIQTRATTIKVRDLTERELGKLVQDKAEDNGLELDSKVVGKIAEVAEGSARKALVLLGQVAGIGKVDQQLAVLENADAKAACIELCRALIAGKDWGTVSKILLALDEEPETVRRMVLGYFNSVALKAGGGGAKAARAIGVMEAFECNYFDSGKAGLTISCFNACSS